MAGERVDPGSLGEAVQALCEQTAIFRVRRGDGKLYASLCRRGRRGCFSHVYEAQALLRKSCCTGRGQGQVTSRSPSNRCLATAERWLMPTTRSELRRGLGRALTPVSSSAACLHSTEQSPATLLA